MSNPLFNEFSEVSAKQWKQKIQFDLKGADYNETLVTKTLEGIDIKPFYHKEGLKTFPTKKYSPSWKIVHRIKVVDEADANEKAIEAFKNGVEAIEFVIFSDKTALNLLLANINLNNVTIYFNPQFISLEFTKKLAEITQNSNRLHFLDQDIINNLAKSGNWYENLEKDHNKLESIVKLAPANMGVLSIDATLYQNSGANAIQQLAYALAHANEYLNYLHNRQIKLTHKTPLRFKIAIGNDYFIEIAKLRALRILYSTLAKEYGLNDECFIQAEPSLRNKTLYDYNVNMLRTTTECMSAILGGADAICNLPYDALYNNANAFGDRISKNQLLILKHESYFDKVSNPVDGTYYIEELTRQLAQEALTLFKQIETGGGFLNQLKEHTIQRKIKENAAKEQEQFNNGKRVLVGTNKYENPQDTMSENLELNPFRKKEARKTIIEPILIKRLAEELEKQRLATEKSE